MGNACGKRHGMPATAHCPPCPHPTSLTCLVCVCPNSAPLILPVPLPRAARPPLFAAEHQGPGGADPQDAGEVQGGRRAAREAAPRESGGSGALKAAPPLLRLWRAVPCLARRSTRDVAKASPLPVRRPFIYGGAAAFWDGGDSFGFVRNEVCALPVG